MHDVARHVGLHCLLFLPSFDILTVCYASLALCSHSNAACVFGIQFTCSHCHLCGHHPTTREPMLEPSRKPRKIASSLPSPPASSTPLFFGSTFVCWLQSKHRVVTQYLPITHLFSLVKQSLCSRISQQCDHVSTSAHTNQPRGAHRLLSSPHEAGKQDFA